MPTLPLDPDQRTEGSQSREPSWHLAETPSSRASSLVVEQLDLATDPLRHFELLKIAAVSMTQACNTPLMREAMADFEAIGDRALAVWAHAASLTYPPGAQIEASDQPSALGAGAEADNQAWAA